MSVYPESLTKALETVGGQTESLMYLQSGLAAEFKKSKAVAEFADLTIEVTKVVESAVSQDLKLANLDPWSGRDGLVELLRAHFSKTEFIAFQEFMAAQSANKILAGEYTLDCIVSDLAEFKRAYSKDGNMLEGEALDAMDTLFNAWIAKYGMISQGGVIHRGNAQGEVIEDKTAAAAIEVASELRTLLSMTEGGLESFLQENNPGVNPSALKLEIRQHPAEVEEQAAPQVNPSSN